MAAAVLLCSIFTELNGFKVSHASHRDCDIADRDGLRLVCGRRRCFHAGIGPSGSATSAATSAPAAATNADTQ